MVSISLGLGLGSSGGPVDPPPIPGFVYLTENSVYLLDEDGAYLLEAE